MLRSAARRAFSLVERFANRRGYLVRWIPPLFFVQPEAELRFDLEFVIAHLLLRKKEIFFIQIGANDGKSTDPLYRFVTELGWSGILVEPQPNVNTILNS